MKQKGFTLTELLVTIAILGVIAAVVALNVANFFGRGGNETIPSDLGIINATVLTSLREQPISTLNQSALQDVIDYCVEKRFHEVAMIYQNQLIIELLQQQEEK